ncbi:MAG TPA: alpha-amylase, partial [Bryobacteraceae bacterium]
RKFLYDATSSDEFCSALLDAFARRKRLAGEAGVLTGQRNRVFRRIWGSTHPNLEPVLEPSSEIDTSIRFGDRFMLKLLRHIQTGVNPGVEMGRILTEQYSFPNVAPFTGALEYRNASSGTEATFGILHGYVPNEGDAWQFTRNHLNGFLERMQAPGHSRAEVEKSAPVNFFDLGFALSEPPELAKELIDSYLSFAENSGKRIAAMHNILARPNADPAFTPEPFTDFYRQSLYHSYIGLADRRFEFLRQRYGDMAPEVRLMASKVLEQEDAIAARFHKLYAQRIYSVRTRYHGRLHLGHLLVTGDDIIIVDFEGDPTLYLSERRIKRCPLRDVANMLHSFGYATQAAMRRFAAGERDETLTRRVIRVWGRFWYSHVSAAFLRGYWSVAKGAPFLPPAQADQQILLDCNLLERALLDVRTDISEKPDLAGIPFRVILHLLDAEAERKIGE